jgi:glutathionyl-hydroquinone reductase
LLTNQSLFFFFFFDSFTSTNTRTLPDKEDAEFPPASGRYHLYVAYACPWAHRTLMVRALKGLEDCISVTVVHPTWQRTRPEDPNDQHAGWMFGVQAGDTAAATTWTNKDGNGGPFPSAFPSNGPDPFDKGAKSIRDVYDRVGDTDGKYTVPILYDTEKHTIVSNESSEIVRMLSSEFNAHAKNPALDLYPQPLRPAIDEVNDWVYPTINNGVYRCGFAKTQDAYNLAIAELTASFDRIDSILQKQRYIAAGSTHPTEADVRLFVTLLRFDEVYAVYFKTNTRSVSRTPAILNYCREIYQLPGVKGTVDMDQIKMHYYTSHPILNYYSIIPAGNDFTGLLEQPHDRATMN